MSDGYTGRRGFNYLQDLNTIPSADEQVEAFNPDDLDIWTNTRFFDFDMGAIAHDPTEDSREQKRPIVETAPTAHIDPSLKEFDSFLNGVCRDCLVVRRPVARMRNIANLPPPAQPDQFDNFDFSPAYVGGFSGAEAQPPLPTATTAPATIRTPSQQPIATAPIAAYTSSNAAASPAAAPVTPAAPTAAPRGFKRKASVSVSAGSPDAYEGMGDSSRLVADEDKRRRNTAASARFRVKKKQKEQQLEKTAKEMTERVQALEQKIQQLELENKWLKGLVVEKNGGKSGEEMMMPPSILAGSKDGVGTV